MGRIFAIAVSLAALLAVTATPADAQRRETGDNANTVADKLDAAQAEIILKRRERDELDRRYRSQLQNSSGGTAKVDPWANAREPTPAKR